MEDVQVSSEQIKNLTQLFQSGVIDKESYERSIANLQPTSQPSTADLIGLGQTDRTEEVPLAGDILGNTRDEPELSNAVPDVLLDDNLLGRTSKQQVSAPVLDSDNLVGKILLERFQVQKRIGKGSFGSVYKAFDTKKEQDVAVKVLHGGAAQSESDIQTFKKEVLSMTKLTHQNLVNVQDFFIDPMPIQIMELASGGELEEKIAKGIDEDNAVAITEQILSGLQYLHEKNIVHLDLKPENILFSGSGEAKIADFGISKSIKELLRSEKTTGTPYYMSPEQFAQSGISPRSDLYSLGLIVYEMLTRKKACVATTYEEATNWHTNISLDVSSLNISDAFKEFISTCTAKDPDKRFLNVQKALDALRGNVKGGQATSSAQLQLEQERLKQEKEQNERQHRLEQEKLKQDKEHRERELKLEEEKLALNKETLSQQLKQPPAVSLIFANIVLVGLIIATVMYGLVISSFMTSNVYAAWAGNLAIGVFATSFIVVFLTIPAWRKMVAWGENHPSSGNAKVLFILSVICAFVGGFGVILEMQARESSVATILAKYDVNDLTATKLPDTVIGTWYSEGNKDDYSEKNEIAQNSINLGQSLSPKTFRFLFSLLILSVDARFTYDIISRPDSIYSLSVSKIK